MSGADIATWDDRAVLTAWERFMTTGESTGDEIRDEVLRSWQRSALSGVQPGTPLELTFDPAFDPESRLLRAARPAIERLEEQLAGSSMSVLLADRRSRVVYRWADSRGLLDQLDRQLAAPGFLYGEEAAGTNGIGTAIEHGRLTCVRGEEHFSESLHRTTCIGVPISHPVSGRLEGVLDLTCHKHETNALMVPLVTQVAHEIRQRLLDQATHQEHRLLEAYVALARRCRRPVVCLSSDLMIAGAIATEALNGTDRELIWDEVAGGLKGSEARVELNLARLGVTRCRPVLDRGELIGALLELPAPEEQSSSRVPSEGRQMRSGENAQSGHLDVILERHAVGTGDVLLVGESGTGKSTIALALADRRLPENGTVVTLDVAERSFERALGDLDLDADRACNIVLLTHLEAATANLLRQIRLRFDQAGPSRPALIGTLVSERPDSGPPPELAGVFETVVALPPLRFHRDEVPEFASAMLKRERKMSTSPQEFSADALRALMRHDWPGNLRELKMVMGVVQRSAPTGPIGLEHLPEPYRDNLWQRPLARLEQLEMDAVVAALRVSDGDKQAAADWLGISRATLYRKIRVYKIDPDKVVGMLSRPQA